MPLGFVPTVIVLTTVLVKISIFDTSFEFLFATQIYVVSIEIDCGFVPTGIV